MSYQKYDAYKDTKIDYVGDIPSAWQIKPLFALAKENKVQNKGNFIDNVLSLSYGRIVRRNIEENMGLLPKSFETYQIIQDGYIVLRLTDLQNDKKSLRVGRATEEGIITSAYLGLIPTKDIYSQYFYYLLHAYDINKVFYNMVGGVRQSMGYSDFKRMPIVLPSIEEQKAIAEFIDKKTSQIDTHIDKQERLIALLKERRTAIINKAVTRGVDENVKLKDSGIDWLGQIPEHWELTKIKHIAQINPSSKAKGISRISEIEFVPMENVSEEHGKIKKYNFKPLHEIDKGYTAFKNDDVIFAKITPCMENGNCAIVKNLTHNIGYGSTEFIVFRAIQKKISIGYLHSILRDKKLRLIAEAHMHGSAGQKRIATSFLANYSIGLPPLKEQTQIVDFINNVITKAENSIYTIENEIILLKEYRQSLISNAVTGKIRVI